MATGAWQSETDVVVCLNCGDEFVTEGGRRCPDCFPEDY
jgi:DNA-directed RNA polymerase subunit RPC12/RpoP